MEFDQEAFGEYLEEMWAHLFGNRSLSQIIVEINNSHRARRFFAMYLIKNRETFHTYYQMRAQFGISSIFDTIISALFHEREKKPAKQKLIDLLQIESGMAGQRVEGYPVKEFDKDLNSFLAYWQKRDGSLQFNPRSYE